MYECKVTRPDFGTADEQVTITATLKKGSVLKTKSYKCYIRQQGMSDTQCVQQDLNWIVIADPTHITKDIPLSTTGPNGSTITWTSDAADVVSETGKVIRPENGAGSKNVVLTATVKKGTSSQSKSITVTVLPWTDAEDVQNAMTLVTWDLIKGSNTDQNAVYTDMQLPTSGTLKTTITWSTTNASLVNIATGAVTRPSFSDGDTSCYLTAEVKKNTTKDYVYIKIVVAKKAITNAEVVQRALDGITDTAIVGSNTDLQHVISDLILPKYSLLDECKTGSFEWEVWKADGSAQDPTNANAKVTAGTSSWTCTITRPLSSASNTTVKLKVTANSSFAEGTSATANKYFTITILKSDV